MQATDKIWMNGELVDWDDARVHVGAHGLHYGTGVFEGIRCYDTPDGAGGVPRHRPHAAPARLGAADRDGDPVLGRRAARGDERAALRERPARVLHPPDRLLRLQGARRLGAGQPGRDGDHDVAVGHLPRRGGAQERHPHQGLELAAHAAERHPARVEGDRRLPQLDARRAARRRTPATTRRSCSRPRAPSPTGRARRSSSSRRARSTRPTSRPGSCTGSRATRSSRSREDLGYTVLEKTLIRSDLYLADEVFMCGTAAEVTPVRSVDDHELGVGDDHAARSRRRTSTPCAASSDRWSQWRELVAERDAARRVSTATRRINALRAVDRRARRGARARGAALGAALARARPGRGSRRCSPTRSARRTAPRSRRARPGCTSACALAGVGPGRRGDHVAVLVRRLGELRDLRGRDAGLRGRRPADVQPRPGRGRGGDHAADEGGRRGRHLRLSVRARRAARDLRAARARARRGRVRGARRALQGPAARLARPSRASGPSTRTSR